MNKHWRAFRRCTRHEYIADGNALNGSVNIYAMNICIVNTGVP